MYNIFLETSEQIHIDDGDSSHLDIHQEDHDEQDVLMILMILMSACIKDQGS